MPRKKRLVRPRFLILLGVALLLGLASSLIPSADERAQREAERLTALPPAAALNELSSESARRRLIDSLAVLKEHGDERRFEQLSVLLLDSPGLSVAELKDLTQAAFADADVWSTRLPRWKTRLLEALADRGGSGALGNLAAFFARAPVTFTLYARAGEFGRLYIAGNWLDDGQIANLQGWRYLPMRQSGQAWTARQMLAPTLYRHVYHAVVRTAPWPKGEAVGEADFSVGGAGVVELRRIARRPAAPREAPDGSEKRVDVALIGLDGATWRAVMPLVNKGELPAFARLIREGYVATTVAAGDRSSIPNIYSALTGKIIARHGLGEDYFGFNLKRRAAPLWVAASEGGKSSAVVSLWSTLPVDLIRGEMVSEAFLAFQALRDAGSQQVARSPEVSLFAGRFGVTPEMIQRLLKFLGYINGVVATTQPPELSPELDRALPYPKVDPRLGLAGFTSVMDEQVVNITRYLEKKGPVNLLCAYLSDVDHAGHAHWAAVEPSLFPAMKGGGDKRVQNEVNRWDEGSGDELLEAYRRADRLVDFAFRHARTVIVFSDHGFGPYAYSFISLNLSMPKLIDRFYRDSKRPPVEGLELLSDYTRYSVSLPKTPENAAAAAALARYLRAAVYLPQQQSIFSNVSQSDEDGRLVIRMTQEQPRPHYVKALAVDGAQLSVLDLFDVQIPEGNHMRDGFAAFWGEKIRGGTREEPMYLVDIAPTALYLLGLPAARDMDGRVLKEAISDGVLAKDPPRFTASYGTGGRPYWRLLKTIQWKILAHRIAPRL